MMTRTARSRNVRRLLGLACILALLPGAFASAGIEPTPFRSGLFGVATGQAVRISVLNAGNSRGVINPCCRIWDAAGRLLFEADAGEVAGGLGTFVDFTPPPVGGPPPDDGRVQLRVEVELQPVPNDGRSKPESAAALRSRLRNVIPTIEVFDIATGRTVYTMPFARVAGIDPTPF